MLVYLHSATLANGATDEDLTDQSRSSSVGDIILANVSVQLEQTLAETQADKELMYPVAKVQILIVQ